MKPSMTGTLFILAAYPCWLLFGSFGFDMGPAAVTAVIASLLVGIIGEHFWTKGTRRSPFQSGRSRPPGGGSRAQRREKRR